MKLNRKAKRQAEEEIGLVGSNVASANENKQKKRIGGLIIITAVLIAWVLLLSYKAQDTVTVVMVSEPVFKNQVITEDVLMPYDMLKGEFDKYAIVKSQGEDKRRLILWDERGEVINSFAAYPLKAESYLEYRDCIKSRTDNSDNILYSFPGKDVLPIEIAVSEMQALKTFLKPGDKINVTAIYKDNTNATDEFGFTTDTSTVTIEQPFTSLIVADMVNSSGDSILDIYSGYEEMSVWEQAQLDASESFKTSTEPKALFVALTPEEKEDYYRYLSKDDVTFRISLPQRDN